MFLAAGATANAEWAVTDRHGGESDEPYRSLNLGEHVGDDPAAVAHNRALVAASIAAPAGLRFMRQLHGTTVAHVRQADSGVVPEADALVTGDRGLALAVLVADCVPVLFAASDGAAVGVAHAGRLGVVAGVVPATLTALQELGAQADALTARVGPAICGRCYEVPASMADEVSSVVPDARTTTRQGSPGLDLPAAVVAQLRAAGVADIEVDPRCTAEHPDLYSHRRDSVTGRYAAVIWLAA
jgi:YfiH family protein